MPGPPARNWTRNQLLHAFRLYCHTPFGKLHRLNPEIIALAENLGRSPSAIAMKACNFASLDPKQHARNIKGLGNASQADRALWDEFTQNPEALAYEIEQAHGLLFENMEPAESPSFPQGPPSFPQIPSSFPRRRESSKENLHDNLPLPTQTETQRPQRVRLVQQFFRSAVLTSYGHQCALSDIALPALLNASHIIPWSQDEKRRADPRNGLCLNALYDRAFDRGLFTIDESNRVLLSPILKDHDSSASDPTLPLHQSALLKLQGQPLRTPTRFTPDPKALAYHREHIYQNTA